MELANDMKLELVQVLFRHGSRVYGQDEYDLLKPEDADRILVEQYGYGQLTNLGKKQAHNLGRALRERYDEFLGKGYRSQEVYAYTTDIDRTKMTLQVVLAGLFPPPDEQRWHPDLHWMPVPFHYAPGEFDFLLRGINKPKYNQIFRDVITNTPEILKINSEIEELTDSLCKHLASKVDRGVFLGVTGALHNVFTIRNSEKRKQPDWYSDELLAKLRHYIESSLDFMAYTTDLKRLGPGILIKQFIENLNVNDEVHNPRKIYLYSGHEFNIATVLKTLEIKNFGYPNFSSAIVIEKLRDSQGRLYIRCLGWNGRDKFFTLKMENCDEICHIDDFLNHVKDVIPSNDEMQELYNDAMKVDVRKALTTDFAYTHKN